MSKTFTLIIFLCLGLKAIWAQDAFYTRLARAAEALTIQKVTYDPAYYVIAYPNGDVPDDRGVCTDVVIRAYRKLGIDLQQLVHEDLYINFSLYPQKWGLKKPDKNIDHRRVPNLMNYFERFGEVLAHSSNAADYQPGEIICWNLGDGLTHIGIVSLTKAANGKSYMIVHNIGAGQVLEDCLMNWKIIGRYRFRS